MTSPGIAKSLSDFRFYHYRARQIATELNGTKSEFFGPLSLIAEDKHQKIRSSMNLPEVKFLFDTELEELQGLLNEYAEYDEISNYDQEMWRTLAEYDHEELMEN